MEEGEGQATLERGRLVLKGNCCLHKAVKYENHITHNNKNNTKSIHGLKTCCIGGTKGPVYWREPNHF